LCRLFGIIPRPGEPLDFSLVRSFRSLAACGTVCEGSEPGHGDGWGIVVWQNGLPVYLGREPKDASKDPEFEEACDKGESINVSSPLIAHLRKASVGLKIRENTHPFTMDDWAFAHNGTIRRLKLRYTTDSQWFFESIVSDSKKNGGNIVDAISKNVKLIREVHPYSSTTFLMSNGKEYYAYRDAAENVEYYTMYYAITRDAFLLSQEKFFEAPWVPLDNGSLLTLGEDLTYEVMPILPELKPRVLSI